MAKNPKANNPINKSLASLALHQGYTQVIDADLSKYFDSIAHTKLLAVCAMRVVDSAILHVIKLWLKAPVLGEDKDGTRKNVGGGKANSNGTLAVRSHIAVTVELLPASS